MAISIPDSNDVTGSNAPAFSTASNSGVIFVREFVTLSAAGSGAVALRSTGNNQGILMDGTAILDSHRRDLDLDLEHQRGSGVRHRIRGVGR